MFRFSVTVTNHGNAPAFSTIVELLSQFVPSEVGGPPPSPYVRKGFEVLGYLEPHGTKSAEVLWGEPGAIRDRARAKKMPSPAELMKVRFSEQIVVATVYEPLLDPRSSLDVGLQNPHQTKVVRRPFGEFDYRNPLQPSLPLEEA